MGLGDRQNDAQRQQMGQVCEGKHYAGWSKEGNGLLMSEELRLTWTSGVEDAEEEHRDL